MNEVRTRFAPSPTGFMHIGNLRTALYTYLIARKNNGKFILRIEDTDQGRYVEGATDVIYNTLKVCGLNWDEGPDIGGPVGPYIQSQRMDMYKQYAEQLVSEGKAYYCFCTKERMEELHKEQAAKGLTPAYDRHCRELSEDEVKGLLNSGAEYVIRQKVPLDGVTTFHDELYGDITVPNADLDDQILIKADGMPTYNFANVIDDHLMGITHVVRGNEYLSSAPKYNLLYNDFGWDIPCYIHVEHIMRDAQHKLSKRDGDAYFGDFVNAGYYVPAILNYIALLGWAPKGENEIFSLEELVSEFDIHGLSKSPAIFDPIKMKAINAEWIRRMPLDSFKAAAMPYIRQTCKSETVNLEVLAKVLQPRTELFTDIPERVDFIDELRDYDNELYLSKKMKITLEIALESLKRALTVFEGISDADWTEDKLHDALFAEIEAMGIKNGQMLLPIRAALSGKQMTPGGGVELAAILGKNESVDRVKKGIARLENNT